eukprot:4598120-Alexandrium_andersonii.AAC.1
MVATAATLKGECLLATIASCLCSRSERFCMTFRTSESVHLSAPSLMSSGLARSMAYWREASSASLAPC